MIPERSLEMAVVWSTCVRRHFSSCGEKDVGFEERGSVTLADRSSRLCDVDLCLFWFDLKSEVLE